ncbi:MAG: HAD-IA family hydrolase [Pyrinomonadaceae bacterium]
MTNPTRTINTLLFDWDGTLLDSAHLGFIAFQKTFDELGVAFRRESYDALYSPNWYTMYEALRLPKERWPAADEMWLRHYGDAPSTLVEGAGETVVELHRRGYRLGVVSSGSQCRVAREIDEARLGSVFEVVVCNEHTTNKKPHPEGLEHALKSLNVLRETCSYVGDSPQDIQLGRSARVLTVGVKSAYPSCVPPDQTFISNRLANSSRTFKFVVTEWTRMKPTVKPRVKICCIGSVEEARLAVEYGASALGLVSEMPSGPGVIPEDLIARITAAAPPAVSTFLLTCSQDADSIIAQQRRAGANTVQICDRLEAGSYEDLRRGMPGVAVVQVVHVTGPEAVEEAVRVSPHVSGILLDSGNQSLSVKELGGTGRTHDWGLSREIRERVAVPVFLAGGLNAENVAEAVRRVRPFGLDVCSGVRTGGRLDESKLASFFRNMAEAQEL